MLLLTDEDTYQGLNHSQKFHNNHSLADSSTSH